MLMLTDVKPSVIMKWFLDSTLTFVECLFEAVCGNEDT